MVQELLLPAGNIDSLKRAVMCGADAVYLGLEKFNARASADNFNSDNIGEHIDYCHLYGVKVYIAFNISIKDNQLSEAKQLIYTINRARADGIIIADIGLIPIINEVAPDMPIHISTQAGAHNRLSADFFYKLGADRIVLARETGIKDIIDIRDNVDIEMEYFVQGALCVSFSGGCLFSSIIHNCSGNRGECLQPCRQKYTLKVNNVERQGYMLSTSDLCLIDRMEELKNIGITSFKIEGRMKRAEYVAQSALSYRRVLDRASTKDKELPYLKRAFNRGDYSEGYIYSGNSDIMSTDIQGHMGEHCGKVIDTFKKGNYHYAEVESKIELTQGDGLKILRGGRECGGADLHNVENKGKGRYIIPVSANVIKGDQIYLTTDNSVNQELNNITKRLPLKILCVAKVNEPLAIHLECADIKASYKSDYIVPEAMKSPTTKEEIIAQLSRLNDTEFILDDIIIQGDVNVFIPKSRLNDLRRQGIEELKKGILNNYRVSIRKNRSKSIVSKVIKKESNLIFAEMQNINQLTQPVIDLTDVVIYNPETYELEDIKNFISKTSELRDVKIYLSLPKVIRYDDITLIESICSTLQELEAGIVADNYSVVQLARDKGLRYIGGLGLNIYNSKSMELLADADYHILSPELTEAEAKPLLDKGAVIFSLGYLPIMTICHCPLKLMSGNDCNKCVYKGDVSYTDNKYTFRARRSKLNTCSYTIYNSLPHNLSNRMTDNNYNQYINMYSYNNDMSEKIISTLQGKRAMWLEQCTGGSYIRNKY